MSRANPAQLLTELRRIDLESPDHDALRYRTAETLAPQLGAMATVITTNDPATLVVTSCALVGLPKDPVLAITTARAEWAADEDFMRAPELLHAPGQALSLHRATGGALDKSQRYRDSMASFGIVDELRTALVARGECWGMLCAYRVDRPFTDAELAAAGQVAEPFAEYLRRALLRALVARPVGVDAPPGILRQTRSGTLEALSPESRALLEQGGASLAEAAMAVIAEAGGNQGRAVVVNAAGQTFALHATTFDGAPAAIVEAPRPAVLADQIIRAWGLTKREREVVSRVLAGESTKEIAGGLQISEYTVQDHLKAIFDKAGVSSRRELVAALLQQHYLPEMARGATPSPYGWYLPA